ncbi:MAG: septum formation initiator family protein [bacterium]|nr:septum formation initiator family protein [bacterium]
MPKNNTPLIKRLFKSKLLIVAEIIVLVFFSSALAQEIIRKYQVQGEVDKLQQELNDLEQKNIELSGLIEYFDSESYKEEQARLQLGLQKPGEQVVAVLGDSTENETEIINKKEKLAINIEDNFTNPQRWWNYFFDTIKEN